jgi:hypothetical protein
MKGTHLHELKKLLFIFGCDFYYNQDESTITIITENGKVDFKFDKDEYFISNSIKNENDDEVYTNI